MPFQCPECSTSGSLRITSRLELPPDSRSDEITLQIVKCSRCGFAGIAVYQESRRGALDSESVDHTGFRVHTGDWKALERAINRCPRPNKWRCKCAAHHKLSRTDAWGRWNALDDLRLEGAFQMKL
jgi:hypothetical protein